MNESLVYGQPYLMANAAIAFAYVIARIIIHLPYFKLNMSQFQHLQTVRYCLIFTIFIFLFTPIVLSLLPNEYYFHFQFDHIRSVSSGFLSQTKIQHEQIQLNNKELNFFSMNHYLVMATLLVGFGIYIIKCIKNFLFFKRFKKESFCQHKINKVHILFNDKCYIPFCFGYFTKYFVALPLAMLTNNKDMKDMKLAIKHELQHIRQGDTHWLHLTSMIKWLFFWNPFIWWFARWFLELQELSCDEAMIVRKKTISATAYAECLMNVANDYLNLNPMHSNQMSQEVIGVHQLSKSFLYRRVNMLFSYKQFQTKTLSVISAYLILFCLSLSAAFALGGSMQNPPLSIEKVKHMMQTSHLDKDFSQAVKPEVVTEINHIRGNRQARAYMKASLQRMKAYEPTIQKVLKEESLPNDLLVIPLVESGYQALDQSKNRVFAAGIWQIIPETGKQLGLVINKNRDDRLNTLLATKAALNYLKSNYTQFQNWQLAMLAYEIGEKNTDRLIKETGSRDVWTIADAIDASKKTEVKRFLSMLYASLIIMHNPSLVN